MALVLATLLVASVLVTSPALGLPDDDNQQEQGPKPSRLQQVRMSIAKIFDFNLYMQLYRKTYSSVIERTVRAKFYMSRAIRVFVAALDYINRKQSYYLSINHMSDETASERLRQRNTVLDARFGAKSAAKPEVGPNQKANERDDVDLLDVSDLSGADTYETLVQVLEEHKSDPNDAQMLEALQELQQNSSRPAEAGQIGGHHLRNQEARRRRKRSTKPDFEPQGKRRRLPLGRLINLCSDSRPSMVMEIPKRVATISPHHAERPDRHSGRMRDRLEPLYYSNYVSRDISQADGTDKQKLSAYGERLRQEAANFDLRHQPDKLPDQVFIDHRQSKCLFAPRNQRTCGACYAFATISLLEYLYCKRTGKRLAFSEQYVIDCGKKFYPGPINGCSGGSIEVAADFFQNYGAELLGLYPFWTKEDTCPYETNYDKQKAGFIRTNLKRAYIMHKNDFAEALQLMPVLVIIETPENFDEYGGGVYSGKNVKTVGKHHAMLIVGHGREDNQEYWLIRNSHSVGWGEAGHIKLAKATTLIKEGLIFGSTDKIQIDMEVRPNHKYDENLILRNTIAARARN